MKGISSYHIKYSTDLAVVKIGGGLPLRYPFFMIAKLPNRAYLGDLIIRGLRASFRRPEAIRRFQAVLPLVAPSEDRRLLGRWREKALMTYCTKDCAVKWRQLYEHFFISSLQHCPEPSFLVSAFKIPVSSLLLDNRESRGLRALLGQMEAAWP